MIVNEKILEQIKELNSNGLNDSQIADRLELSRGTVQYHRSNLGLEPRHGLQKTLIRISEPIDLAYLAGFFDGEGTISIKVYHSSMHTIFQIDNTCRNVLDVLENKIGAGTVSERKKYSSSHSTCYRYCINTELDIFVLLKKILPYLIVKKDRACIAIKILEMRLLKPLGIKTMNEEFDLIEKLRILNKRGKSNVNY